MLHRMISALLPGLAALLALTGLWNAPAFAKTKVDGETLRLNCIGAFGDHDHFDWVPRMGLANALSTCRAALLRYPDDPEVRLYDAVARDQFAERGGTQDDNIFATGVYRTLAADGLPKAEYALATMFDESAGVSTAEALGSMQRARAGEFGESIRCEALRTFGVADLDGTGPAYDVAAAEAMARSNYVCAGMLAGMYWSGYVAAADLPLKVAEYARYAAVHGDANAMAMLGLFYVYGTGSSDIDPQLRGQYVAKQDIERAGHWLLLARWATRSAMRPQVHADFWDNGYLRSAEIVEAMQTALKSLGHYEGAVDGNFLTATSEALRDFEQSDIDAVFQAVRAKEKYDSTLGPRETLHIGDAALAPGD
jgi:hypothetical protein